MSLSSNLSISSDRFRLRSIQFRSPLRQCHHEKRTNSSPDRPRIRKVQVHPQNIISSESKRLEHDVSKLFHTTKQSAMTKSLQLDDEKFKTCPKTFFNTRPTSNVVGILDCKNLSLVNPSYSTKTQSLEPICPPTPCMVRYRHYSASTSIPTRIIKRPKSSDDLIKMSNIDCIDQIDAE